MPFLKYFGAIPPTSVEDLINFDDLEHSSKHGWDSFLKSINVRCESEGIPREEWNKALIESIKLKPYPGMSHIGGVCKAPANIMRPWDIEISEIEYVEIRKNIEKENTIYRNRIEKENVCLNDPNIRALPEHENLGWKSRAWVISYTVLERHTPYSIGDEAQAYCRSIEYFPNGTTVQLIDIYHSSTSELKDVMLDGLDLMEWFVDLLAILGFGASHLAEFVCTSPTTCCEGESFTIAAPVARIFNKPVRVSPLALKDLGDGRTVRMVARSFRDGLAALHPASAVGHLWNTVEQTAQATAKKRILKRLAKCEKCGHKRNVGWDTKSIFGELYSKTGLSPSLFDSHRSLRGKVQHGAHLRTASPVPELLTAVSTLQSVAGVAAAECLGIKPQVGSYLNGQSPVMTLVCEVKGDQMIVQWDSQTNRISSACLPERYFEQNSRSTFAGIQGDPPANPLFIPPVI